MCEIDGSFKTAEIVENGKFICLDQQTEFGEHKTIVEVINTFQDYVKKLEQQYVKVEILFSFMKSEGVLETMSEENIKELNTLYEKVMYELEIVEAKAEGLPRDCKYKDFDFLEQ